MTPPGPAGEERRREPSLPWEELLELGVILAVIQVSRRIALPFAPPSTVAAFLFLYAPILHLRGKAWPSWLVTSGPSPGRTAGLAALLLLGGAGAFLLWTRLPLPAYLLPPPPGATRWDLFLPATAVTALAEEVYFRGRVHDALAEKGLPPVAGSALLFAVAHVFLFPTAWRAMTFFPALLFGWLRERTGSVHGCAVLHFAFNLFPVLLAGGAP